MGSENSAVFLMCRKKILSTNEYEIEIWGTHKSKYLLEGVPKDILEAGGGKMS